MTFFKTTIKLFVIFFLMTTYLSGQQAKNRQVVDTLFIFGKKYPVLKTQNYLTTVFDFPFAVFTSQYKGTGKRVEYKSIIREECLSTLDFDDCGNGINILLCIGQEHDTFSLNDFVDSLEIDINNFDYNNIKLKSGATWKEINRMQYKVVYDSTFLTLQIDGNCIDYKSLGKLIHNKKELPKFMVLNTLFYVDEKQSVSYYLPCEFIITLK